MRLSGRVAVITGAASGIGRATALLFAKEGAKVVVADINDENGLRTAQEIRSNGEEAIFVHTDVTKIADVRNMVERTMENYGKLDILFNNAGTGSGVSITELEEEEWDRVLNLNLRSIYLCSRHAIPEMMKSGGGSIINMSSIGGLVAQGGAAFCASKGGAVSLTRNMAIALGDRGIRVNCVCPTVIKTPMTEKWILENTGTPEKIKRFIGRYGGSLGRLGRPEEVAATALFLASDESSLITGVILPIDAGYTAR